MAKAISEGQAKEFPELTGDQIADHGNVLPDSSGTFMIVRTNEGRLTKLLVQSARQRTGMETTLPILLIEKYLTIREGTEKAARASGQNVQVYGGSRYHLDLGQIVPEKAGGDLLVEDIEGNPGGIKVKPIGKAKLYLLTKAIPDVVPKKSPRLVVGEKFETRYFNGKYKLQDDGRRSGTLTLEVNDEGEISGSYYSDKDGQKYDVKGKIGTPTHALSFVIKFPQVEQQFNGFLFTGNGKVIAGTSKLQDRDTAFFAERIEE